MLAFYFERRLYTLQHLKYKLLCRWANHAISSDRLEAIGSDATFFYGKLELNIENAMARCDRLKNRDCFDQASP